MNRTKSILVAASIMLAMAFTISCSGEDGGGGDDDNGGRSNSGNGASSGDGASSGGNAWCVNHQDRDCNNQPACTSNLADCQYGWGLAYGISAELVELNDNCPAGYTPRTQGCRASGGGSSSDGRGSSSSSGPDGGRDETYETAIIGSQFWMAKNLNIEVPGSVCYDDDPVNCEKYGRLYSWEAAKEACPNGWRLPSDEDWEELMAGVGATAEYGTYGVYYPNAGNKLKAASGWDGSNSDEFGFSALPGGYSRSTNNYYGGVGIVGIWWSSSDPFSYGTGYYWRVHNEENAVDYSSAFSDDLLSVRCLKGDRVAAWCVNNTIMDCNNQLACTSSLEACQSGWSRGVHANNMELADNCPMGYVQQTQGCQNF